MRFNSFGLALLGLALASPAPAQPAAPEPVFTPESFRSHVAFLADDRLEGRDTGSRGYDLAALYVASRFEALGLKPAGKDGWYQQVPFLESRLGGEPGALTIGGRRFLHGQEVILSPTPDEGARLDRGAGRLRRLRPRSPGNRDRRLQGPRRAREGGRRPERLPARAEERRRRPSQLGARRAVASSHGAVGLVLIRTQEETKRRPWARMQQNAGRALDGLGRRGRPPLHAGAGPPLPGDARLAGRRGFVRRSEDSARPRPRRGGAERRPAQGIRPEAENRGQPAKRASALHQPERARGAAGIGSEAGRRICAPDGPSRP